MVIAGVSAGLLHTAEGPPSTIRFDDIARSAGVDFVLRNSATPAKHQIETMVTGVAVFDYDNDSRPDIYFVNGATQPELKKGDPVFFNRLYHNNGDGTFSDVTVRAGVEGEGFSMGVSAADYDNDGFSDLFVTGVNRNVLYRNRGDGTFEDVTTKAGVGQGAGSGKKPWSVASGWFDYDNDGKLDLFIVNYCDWDPAAEPPCTINKARVYCHPKYYRGLPNTLYRNNGDGTFTDVSGVSGIGAHVGKGMGVAFLDYDGDGRLDVFVANDTTHNFLFRNLGNGRFEETALAAGVAYNEDGRVLSSMGAEARDLDGDGREELFLSALNNETFPLFRNLGRGLFADATYSSGIGAATLAFTGWSNGVHDLDNDGQKDLFIANGGLDASANSSSKQRNLVLANLGGGRFKDVSAQAGPAFQQTGLHRGAAFGDLDNDGLVDAVVTRIGESAEIFRNVCNARHHWIGIALRGRRSNRDGIGARIRVAAASGGAQWNRVTAATGYGCSSDRRIVFGLGRDTSARVEIEWPSGTRQTMENVAVDRYLTVEEP